MTQRYAFFDVDGTLLHLKSMFSFHDFWYRRWKDPNDPVAAEEYKDVTAILRALADSDEPRELINRRYYEFFSGRSVDDVTRCAQAWARSAIANPRLFIPEVIEELDSLRAKGIEPVFVSGSFLEVLAPLAEHLGVRQVLATRLLHADGKYTGRFESPQTIGQGKATAIDEFLARQGSTAADCWAFGDDVSDLPLLSAVGHPVAVIGDRALGAAARHRGWRCLHLGSSEEQSLIQASMPALVGAAT